MAQLTENNNNKPSADKPPRKSLQQTGWKSEVALSVSHQSHGDDQMSSSDAMSVSVSSASSRVSAHPLGGSHSASCLPSEGQTYPTHSDSVERIPSAKDNEESPSIQDRISRFEKSKRPSPRSRYYPSNSSSSSQEKVDTPKRSQYHSRQENTPEVSRTPQRANRERDTSDPLSRGGYPSDRNRVHLIGQYGDSENQSQTRYNSAGVGRYNSSGSDYSDRSGRSTGHYSAERIPKPELPPPDNDNSVPPQIPKRPESSRYSQNNVPYGDSKLRDMNRNNEKSDQVTNNNIHKKDSFSRRQLPNLQKQDSFNQNQNSNLQNGYSGYSEQERYSPRENTTASTRKISSYSVSENATGARVSSPEHSAITVNHGRQPSQEELECDQHVQQFVQVVDSSDPKLTQVLRKEDYGRNKYMPSETSPGASHSPSRSPTNRSPKNSNLSLKDSPLQLQIHSDDKKR